MTLITYLTRIHFADGVLEEALRAEMERLSKRRPLIIAENGHLTGAIAERFFSSFPIRTSAEVFADVAPLATERAAIQISTLYRKTDRDLVIAFGSSQAIDMAKVVRIALAHNEPISALSRDEGGAQRIAKDLPHLIAVPGISGFASAVSDYARVKLMAGGQVLFSSKNLIPNVTICDPTLTLGSAPAASASAASGVISRGIEAYLSPGYNPPADGLALDGLGRIVTHVEHVLRDDDLIARREMMAGSLNSALALQKGLCVVHAITNALASVTDVRIDPCAVGRLIMPALIRFYGTRSNGKTEVLKHRLGIDAGSDLADGIACLMAGFPLPNSLAEMGLQPPDIEAAAEVAVQDRSIANGPRKLGEDDVRAILSTAL